MYRSIKRPMARMIQLRADTATRAPACGLGRPCGRSRVRRRPWRPCAPSRRSCRAARPSSAASRTRLAAAPAGLNPRRAWASAHTLLGLFNRGMRDFQGSSSIGCKGLGCAPASRPHLAYLASVKPIAFAQFRWAVEQEHGFAFRADDMDMRRRVVVGVDRDPQAVDAQDCGRGATRLKPNWLGSCGPCLVLLRRFAGRVEPELLTQMRELL